MNGTEFADAIEKLIEGKLAKATKLGKGETWTDMDEILNRNYVANAKAQIANLFPALVD
jgi:hypothetical protein